MHHCFHLRRPARCALTLTVLLILAMDAASHAETPAEIADMNRQFASDPMTCGQIAVADRGKVSERLIARNVPKWALKLAPALGAHETLWIWHVSCDHKHHKLRFYLPGSPLARSFGGIYATPDGRFADWASGYAAFQNVIANKIDEYRTIARMAPTYAKPDIWSDNWARDVADKSGIGLNEPLDYTNRDQMMRLENAIMDTEGFPPDKITEILSTPRVTPGISPDYGTKAVHARRHRETTAGAGARVGAPD